MSIVRKNFQRLNWRLGILCRLHAGVCYSLHFSTANAQLGFDGSLFGMFKGSGKVESKEFKQEPPRESLTQPPPGYQTPSSSYLYGTGPKESLNKEYNPAAGKYGE